MYRVFYVNFFDFPCYKAFDTLPEALKYATKKQGYVEKFNEKTGYYTRISMN